VCDPHSGTESGTAFALLDRGRCRSFDGEFR
jgi:hypothetical protein